MQITKAPMQALNNSEALKDSETCGCFGCLKIFTPSDIVSWTDSGNTAVCPHCERDMVLPSNTGEINHDFLTKIQKYWLPERNQQ